MKSKHLLPALTPLLFGLTAACSTPAQNTGTGGAGGADGGPPPSIQPPPPGGLMPPPRIAPDITFAISKLYVGDTDRDGTANKVNGWKQYGFDLDRRTSTWTSTDLCIPRDGASPKNPYPDGNDGIDNSFGRNIVPILLGLSATFSEKENASITAGKYTLLFHVQNIGPGESYNPLFGRAYTGADMGQPPAFDGSDKWPIDPASVADPADVTSAKTRFSKSYLTANTWVGRAEGDLTLTLTLYSYDIHLPIKHAIIAMDLSPDHTAAENGTIAGVIPIDALVAEAKQAAGAYGGPSYCTGDTIDSIVAQIESAADILQDSSQDPTKVCDAVSIGLGFDAKVVKLGAIAPAVPAPPDPCPP